MNALFTALRRSPFVAMAGLGLSVLLLLPSACGEDDVTRSCTVNADCASGQCRADGTCASATTADAGTSTPETDGSVSDSATTDAPPPVVDSGLCTANADGVITAAEVPLRAGLKGTFKVTTSGVKVSTAGTGAEGGAARTWDFSAALTGDHTLVLETMPLTGQWFESTYPGATYAVRLSDAKDLLGVFAVSAGALELRGVVSPASGSGSYKTTYNPTVPTLAFPIEKGKKWEVTATASGDIPLTLNVPYTEKYTFEVDAEGELKTSTSLGSFKVLRINSLLKKTLTGSVVSTYTRSYIYVAECYGAVAKVVSAADQFTEPPADFVDAAEVQRLSP